MSKKVKHYIVTVEKVSTYEVIVDTISEEKATKLAEQAVKNDEADEIDYDIEVTDVYEDYDSED